MFLLLELGLQLPQIAITSLSLEGKTKTLGSMILGALASPIIASQG
jgi:hypothetical protein